MNLLHLYRNRYRLAFVLLLTNLVIAPTARSESVNVPNQVSTPQLFENIWDAATLYRNPQNAALQSFALVGRYHGQYWSVDADQGDASDWDNRRIIFGFQAKIYEEFEIQVQMHVSEDFSPVYKGLYVGFLKWAPKEYNFSVTLGRLDYVYTGLERTTSSKKMSTFERGLLVNQLMPGEVFGLYTEASNDTISAQAGVFSGSTKEEFGDFHSGQAAMLGLGYALPLFYEQGSLHLDYLYNDGDRDNASFKPYRNVVSIWHQGHRGDWGMGVDFTKGSGGLDGRSNVSGFTLLPTYDMSQNLLIGGDALQLALRYQYARSDQNNGLLLPRRYEQIVATGAGDHYQAYYFGLNYFLNDDKLKLMAGAEYAQMLDSANDGGEYQGWTYLAGLRLYF
jgi:phosphate-selective porin OprO/OprP